MDQDRQDRIAAVFGSSRAVPGDGVYEQGVELGRLLAEAGFGVTNGGYAGLMEAVSAGAAGAGGRVVGVTAPPLFPARVGGNRFLTEQITAGSLTERIHIMWEMACAAVVWPGSIGTFTELAVVWNDAVLAVRRGGAARPVIAFRGRWEELVSRLTVDLAADPGLVSMVDTPSEAVEELLRLTDADGS